MPTKRLRKDEFHRVRMINMKVGDLAEVTGFHCCGSGYFIEVGIKEI